MFDFFKDLNNKLNNVLSVNDREVNKVNGGVPYVADLELEKEIDNWLKKFGLGEYSFGIVLLKLGFQPDKTIYLKRDNNSENLTCYFGYEKELDENKKMILSDGGVHYKQRAGVIILDDNSEKYYRSAPPIYEYGATYFRMVKDREIVTKRINNETTIVNEYFYSGIKITIKKQNGLEIKLYCYGDLNFGENNELELEQYLISLDSFVDIFSVYKKICQLSFVDEIINLELSFKQGKEILASLEDSRSSLVGESLYKRNFKIKDNNRNISYERYITTNRTVELYGDEDSNVVKMKVKNGIYGFVLLVKPVDLRYLDYDSERRRKYKLNNEIELRDYLLSLEFPIKIDEVFERIREISLGKYDSIKLDFNYCGKNISSLYFKNGKFNFYKLIEDGKEISVNEYGHFVYKSNNGESDYSIDIVDDKIMKYEFVSKNGLSMDTDNRIEPLQMVISDVKEERVKTRKLIDKIIK